MSLNINSYEWHHLISTHSILQISVWLIACDGNKVWPRISELAVISQRGGEHRGGYSFQSIKIEGCKLYKNCLAHKTFPHSEQTKKESYLKKQVLLSRVAILNWCSTASRGGMNCRETTFSRETSLYCPNTLPTRCHTQYKGDIVPFVKLKIDFHALPEVSPAYRCLHFSP